MLSEEHAAIPELESDTRNITIMFEHACARLQGLGPQPRTSDARAALRNDLTANHTLMKVNTKIEKSRLVKYAHCIHWPCSGLQRRDKPGRSISWFLCRGCGCCYRSTSCSWPASSGVVQ